MKLINKSRNTLSGIIITCSFIFIIGICRGGDNNQESGKVYKVYITEMGNTIYKNPKGGYEGFYADLWDDIAKQLNIKYIYVQVNNIQDIIDALQNGSADFGFPCIGTDFDNKYNIDVSVQLDNRGVQILRYKNINVEIEQIIGVIKDLFISRFTFYAIIIIIIFAVISGHVIWLFERKRNNHFPRQYFSGIFEGIMWAIETITTVGYGQYSVKHPVSKIFVMLYMIVGALLFAAITSLITVKTAISSTSLNTSIVGPRDLFEKRIAIYKTSPLYSNILKEKYNAQVIEVNNINEALTLLRKDEADCLLSDSYYLQWLLKTKPDAMNEFYLVGTVFEWNNYGIGMSKNNPYLQSINKIILDIYKKDQYSFLFNKWYSQ